MAILQRMHNPLLQLFLAMIVAGALPWGCIVHCMMHSTHIHQQGAECDMQVSVQNQPVSPNQITSPTYTRTAVHVVIISHFLTIKEFRFIEALLTKKLTLTSIVTTPISPPPR
jgi:hypothetical protein